MLRPIIAAVLILLAGFFGAFMWVKWYSLLTEPRVVYKIVNVPPTDEQLLQWWFGSGDKAKLRERICK